MITFAVGRQDELARSGNSSFMLAEDFPMHKESSVAQLGHVNIPLQSFGGLSTCTHISLPLFRPGSLVVSATNERDRRGTQVLPPKIERLRDWIYSDARFI